MVELIKDLIKFVSGVIILLMIFTVIFSPEGIASNTFNYLAFVEPILLQDYISTALSVGSYSSGEFSTSIQTTGQSHKVEIYTINDVTYVHAIPSTETYLKTKFASLNPTPVIVKCAIQNQTIQLPKESPVHRITIRKTINETFNYCNMTVFI